MFFAISGFLIIGHLVRESRGGRAIALISFWDRRARRLLPAGLLVLAATAIAVMLWVPSVLWPQFLGEVGASAIYVQNWLLAVNSVDYLRADNLASPSQHYWSLSVEEQFYILWPAVIALLLFLLRGRIPPRRIFGLALVTLTIASLAYSEYGVQTDPAASYFTTTSRAWEFGLGGIAALYLGDGARRSLAVRIAASWLGFGALAFTLLTLTPQTPFPGANALLPVIGTLLVIWGGMQRFTPAYVLKSRPIQWVGDISYSLYLWHWPLIIIGPYIIGGPLNTWQRIFALAVAFTLAWATKVGVEDPFRNSKALGHRRPGVSMALLITASVVVAALCSGVIYRVDASTAEAAVAAQALIAKDAACVGALAMVNDCARPFQVNRLTDPTVAATDIGKGVQVSDECKQTLEDSSVIRCEIGDLTSQSKVIALVGDSHAGHFLEAFDLYGQQNATKYVTYLKTWCAGTGQNGVAARANETPAGVKSCADWGTAVIQDIASSAEISSAVFSNYTQSYSTPNPQGIGRTVSAEDFESGWEKIRAVGKTVVVLKDVPNANGVNIPECIALNMDMYDPCTTPIYESVPPDSTNPLLLAATQSNVPVVDLQPYFCTDTCHSVIGGLIVYFGDHHMTATFSRTLAPILGRAVLGFTDSPG